MPSLHSLGSNSLKDEGTIAVCNALKDSKVSKLKELVLSRNLIKVSGAESVAAYLAVTASVTCVDVRGNNIAGDGASELSAAVLANTKIEVFNEIPIKEMRADALTELDLKGKGIGVEGGMVVAGLVPVMGSLTSLDLSSNSLCSVTETGYIKASKVQGASFNVGDKVMYEGKEMIVSRAKDSDGDIKMTNLPDLSGVNAIADALRVNGSLTSVR